MAKLASLRFIALKILQSVLLHFFGRKAFASTFVAILIQEKKLPQLLLQFFFKEKFCHNFCGKIFKRENFATASIFGRNNRKNKPLFLHRVPLKNKTRRSYFDLLSCYGKLRAWFFSSCFVSFCYFRFAVMQKTRSPSRDEF